MLHKTWGLIIVAVLAAACADSGTTSTDGPTGPSSPTVTSVTISGTLAITNIGQTSQLSATAHFAKGTTQNVTSQATWSSSNVAIATVTAGGLVTSTGVGDATITASYQSVSGSTRVTVTRPPSYVLSGQVTESVPTTSTKKSQARTSSSWMESTREGLRRPTPRGTTQSGRYRREPSACAPPCPDTPTARSR